MMHVHHADRFAPLLDALAEVLAPPLADPFAPDLVAVPTVGVRDAITAGLGHRLGSTGAGDGVVANVEFVFPGGLVGRALGATPEVPGSAAGDPWELDRLVWSVLEELADGGNAGPGARPGDEWALARRLADLFDRYASQRPGMVQGWADGRATDGVVDEHGVEGVLGPAHRWQFELWRAVRERIGAPSPAERLPGLLAALRTGATRPELPDRVCAFGLASVAPALLRVLHALGAQREVHLFVRHPSRIAWDTSPHALSALAPRSQLDVTVSTTHPLLTSWARPALETRALVGGLPDVVSSACGALTAPPVTLLGVVQGAVRADTAPALAPGVDAADGTIQVHACHGAVRQLEVLRDALGHAFVHDRTLQPHDVLVLCPDLERFAPLVEPVFGRGALPVPVRVGDRSLTTEDPVAAALVAVLALAAGRCTLSELLTFLQMDPVRARFAITQADVELLTSWCEELGTKWGIEAAHRADWGLPVDVETGTWRTGLDRLMAGAALAAPTPRAALGNVAPYDDISTDGFTLAGKIADVVARLSRLHDVLHTRMGVDAWIELLHATLDEFVLTDFDSQWRVQAVHRALNDVAVAAGGSAVPLSLSDVQALLATQLDGAPGRLALRTGAVTVSSLVPLRGVPARVVCLLGFDDEALRAGTFDGDDILGLRPCVGERHPRHELRHLLLDAVLAAQERLVITCDGADITTNRKMPFAVPLAELLDVVARTVPIGESRAPVVLRHPRHGFADPALLSGALVVGGAFTFDPAMLRAAQARRAVTATDPRQNAGSRWQLPPVRCDEVTVGDLVTAVTQPARVLLVQRLEVSLPDEADAVDDNLALGITPLEASTLGRGLLGARRVGATGWEEAARLGGALPPGELATAVLDEVSDAVEAIEVRASVHGVPLAGADVVAVDQLLNVPALPGAPDVRITGDIEGFAGSCLVRVDFVRPRPSHKLTAALRLALVQRQDPARDWTAVLVTRAGSGDEALGVRLRIRGEGAEREAHAAAIVTVAVELLEWARRDAVPLFDRVSPHLAVGDLGHAEGQINQMYDDYAALLWPALDLETLRNEPIDPLDPESVRSRAPDPRAIAVAKWVWETYADHVEEFERVTAAVRGLAGLGNDELDLEEDLPDGRTVIEASAGTGKTYALSALAVRALAEGRVTTAELLMVTFTRAAAAELRERTRATLLIADEMLRTGGDPPASHPWMRVLHAEDESDERERARRVHAAVHTFDDATITTIHGYCQQALRQIGLRAGTRLGAGLAAQSAALVDEVCRDLLVSRLVEDAHALSWVVEGEPAGAGLVLKRLNESVSKLLGNPGAMVVPDPANAAPAATDSLDRLARWCALVEQVRAEVLQRREARQQMAFDDLVTHLLAAVTNPEHGPAVVDDLRARHRLALLDEFQDTDPVQWRIFERVFTDRMVIVGDPKQAIYRFRGADVHAYLAATQGASTYRLGTNRRSDSDLVTATNTLVRGVRLGHPHIVGTDVEPAPDAATRSLGEGPPLELRHLAAAPQLLTKTGQVSAPLSRHAILADLVRVVGAVLDEHPDIDPGDIAVLVPSHPSAEMVYDALNRAGIPAVRTRTGSVLATPALEQWQLLLAALERPSHAPTVRGAALGALLETEVARLDPLSDGAGPLVVALQQRCMDWADRLSRTPLLAWYDAVREESGLVPRLLARPGGERMLTDLDHVAELLAAELGGRGNSVPAVRRTLHALAATAVEETDPQMRRIDSDARAVQITTLHASKGLEYPVVLLPFSWQTPPNMAPFVFQADQGRVVDVASNQGWSGPPLRSGDPDASNEVRKHYNSAEGRGDQLRLLYVGLTRAQRRTVVWWTPASGATSSALGALLLDRDDEGVPCNSEPSVTENEKRKVTTFIPKVDVNDDVVRRKLGVLAANGNGTIGVTECPADGPSIVWRGRHDTGGGELTVADPSGRWLADRSWRRWSFTALAQTAGDDFAVPVTGGADEPPQADVDVGDALVRPSMPLANATGGAAFGTFVHSVMEEVDPAGADLESALAALVTRQSERDRLPVGEDDVVRGLAAAMRTPLGPIAAGRCLADIPRHDRLAELRFDLPLVKATGRFAATAIGDVLQATLPRNDVLRPYAADLANGRFDGTLAGYLQGSIDAVLRVPDGLFDQRYVVVDYKTNRLHDFDDVDPLAAYRPDRLVAAMTHSDYPLQALLYSVALHRYLRWRLPGYQPERHLGGIAYLFVRGMVGVATPQHGGMPYGVFAWRPPAATILGLDALFATGGRS